MPLKMLRNPVHGVGERIPTKEVCVGHAFKYFLHKRTVPL